MRKSKKGRCPICANVIKDPYKKNSFSQSPLYLKIIFFILFGSIIAFLTVFIIMTLF